MLATYKGDSKSVVFDGVTFKKGEPVEYLGDHSAKLANNRFFDCQGVKVEQKKPFPTDSKSALEKWAKENLSIDLDKRKGLNKLIAEVEAELEKGNGAD